MAFYYMRADEIATLNATVTTSAGTTDSDYTDEWICDGRPGRPARATNGTVTWSATFTSAEVGLIAVCNCNSDVDATIGGGASATVTAGALKANGIRLNGFTTVTPANETNLTVGFSGAAATVVLGEFIAGKYRTLSPAPHRETDFDLEDFARESGAEFGSVPPYDPGMEARVFSGWQVYSTADRDLIIEWWRSQRAHTRPSLIVPDSTVNDAWVGYLNKPTYRIVGPDKWRVNLVFRELPRSRW